MREVEILTLESPIITAAKLALRKAKPIISYTNVGDAMRNPIRNAGFNMRLCVLRSYFDNRLLLAEDTRFMRRDYRTFIMGHKGDIKTLTPGTKEDFLMNSWNRWEMHMKNRRHILIRSEALYLIKMRNHLERP
ncbi:hypothetical protein OXIME_000137 [Oxyplasma meridianum]|uniref:Uncharacterized protein n=1 Tax=Oxyplasma meridianum TaxID=3073602 RepID=A0AAX4NF90_9ARCH